MAIKEFTGDLDPVAQPQEFTGDLDPVNTQVPVQAAAPPAPESWRDTFSSIPAQVSDLARRTIAGIKLQSFEELARADDHTDQSDKAKTDRAARPGHIEALRQTIADSLQDPAAAPKGSQNILQRGVQGAASSLAIGAPALAVGVLTRNPFLAASAAYAPTASEDYAELRNQNVAPERAAKFSALNGMFESGTELLPAKELFKTGTEYFKKLVRFLVHELPGESVATVTQEISDTVAKLPDDATSGEVIDGIKQGALSGAAQLPDTAVITLLAGGAQHGLVTVADKATASTPYAHVALDKIYKAQKAAAETQAKDKKLPTSIAEQFVEQTAMKSAEAAATNAAALLTGAPLPDAVQKTVDQLDETALTGYKPYIALRESGLSHEAATAQVIRDPKIAWGLGAAAANEQAGGDNDVNRLMRQWVGRGAAIDDFTTKWFGGGKDSATWEHVLATASASTADSTASTGAQLDTFQAAKRAYETAQAAAADPSVRVDFASVQEAQKAYRQATVDLGAAALNSGALKPAQQKAVAQALKQAQEAGFETELKAPAPEVRTDVKPNAALSEHETTRLDHLDRIANADQIEHTDMTSLAADGLAKTIPGGKAILTPEGRRQRKSLQGRLDTIEQQEAAAKEKGAAQASPAPAKGPANTRKAPTARGMAQVAARKPVSVKIEKPKAPKTLKLPAERRAAKQTQAAAERAQLADKVEKAVTTDKAYAARNAEKATAEQAQRDQDFAAARNQAADQIVTAAQYTQKPSSVPLSEALQGAPAERVAAPKPMAKAARIAQHARDLERITEQTLGERAPATPAEKRSHKQAIKKLATGVESKITSKAPVAEKRTTVAKNATAGTYTKLKAGDKAGGLEVRAHVPNLASIEASFTHPKVEPGIQAIPMEAFDPNYIRGVKARALDAHTQSLKEQIHASKEINPLIVGRDKEGLYIVEGGHRFDALIHLGAKIVPAVVVQERGDLPTKPSSETPEGSKRTSERIGDTGFQVTKNAPADLIKDQAIEPGSVVISTDKSTDPRGFLSMLPKGDTLQIRRATLKPEYQAKGLGKDLLMAAADHAASTGKNLVSDESVTVAQLRVYESLKKAGKLKFNYTDPKAVSEALRDASAGTPVKTPGGSVVTDIRPTEVKPAPPGKKGAEPRGLSVNSLQKIVNQYRKELGVKVKIASTPNDLPKFQGDSILRNETEGVFMNYPDGSTEIWLVHQNLKDEAAAHRVIIHEAVGHDGLRAVLGGNYAKTMQAIRRTYPSQVRAMAARNGIPWVTKAGPLQEKFRNMAAEEVVAYASEKVLLGKGSHLSIWARIIARIRTALRNVGLLKHLSPDDITDLILRARDAVIKRNRVNAGGAAHYEAAFETARRKRDPAPLQGMPTRVQIPGVGPVEVGPFQTARDAADAYREKSGLGLPEPQTYVKVDPKFGARVAQAFDEMVHNPNDPQTKAAYAALIDETTAQYQAIKDTGLKIEFITGKDPYAASPRLAVEDVKNNNHLWVFPTEAGFGSGEVQDSPMLAPTDEKIGDRTLLANDVFRIVHDYFGHVKEGNGFRADGEENAWRIHASMYSPLARAAMTTETRGQNSWLNFGPHGTKNQTAKSAETVYAPQKVGLLPKEFWEDPQAEQTMRRVKAQQATVNVGLNTPDGRGITAEDVRVALRDTGVRIVKDAVHQSDTEETVVAKLNRALTPEEAHALAERLHQDAIAQTVGDAGELHGPKAADWRPFNPAHFVTLEGKRLKEKDPAPEKAPARNMESDNSKVPTEEAATPNPEEQDDVETMRSVMGPKTGDPDVDSLMAKIGGPRRTLKQMWQDWTQNLGDRSIQAAFDDFHGIKRAETLSGISTADQGYANARLSRSSAELTQSIVEYGPPVWNGDAADIGKGMGLMQILKPLGPKVNLFLTYMVAKRANRLMGEGRENLFSKAEIAAGMALGQQNPEFQVAARHFATLNKQVLDFAQEAGIIDPDSRALWENADYIPFYRMIENGNVKQSTNASALGKVRNQIKKLTGGDQNIGDPLENIVRNWLALTDASLKAQATRTVVDNLDGTGFVKKVPNVEMTQAIVPLSEIKKFLKTNPVLAQNLQSIGVNPANLPANAFTGLQKMMAVQAPTGDDIVTVWRNGKREYWRSTDDMLTESLLSISAKAWGPLMEVFRFPKRVLTATTTITPQFAVKNLWRDMWHSFVQGTSDGKTIVPMKDTILGAISTIKMDSTAQSLLAGGGSMTHGYIRGGDTQGSVATIRGALTKAKGAAYVANTPAKLWHMYRGLLDASENAHRVAVYNKALASGRTRKEALLEARDLLDFSMRGNNGLLKFLVESVPFFNARLQGLYRLGRGVRGNPVPVLLRGALMAAASVALLARNRDDDRYKELTQDQKNTYWHAFDVFSKGDHIKIPKPFEVGTVFGTVPEAIGDALITNADEPDAAKQSLQLMGHALGQVLNLSPQPQTLWPLVELGLNQNTFTGAPILTQGDQDKLPEDQDNPGINSTYRWLARAMPKSKLDLGLVTLATPDALRSPKQLQHLGRGYLGNVQDYVLLVTDKLAQRAMGEPAPPAKALEDMPGLRDFYTKSVSRHTKYMDTMFKISDAADKAANSMKLATDQGNDERVDSLNKDYGQLLDVRDDLSKAKKSVIDMRKQQREVQLDPDMTPAEKREEVDSLQQAINDTAKDVWDLRPGGKLNQADTTALLGAPHTEQVAILKRNGLPATAALLDGMK